MRVALLNADATAWSYALRLLAAGDSVLVWASGLGTWSETVRSSAPTARYDEPWETLLAGNVAELVIVGRTPRSSEAETADQLAKLLRAGVSLAVSYPPALGVLAAYELEMIREDAQLELRPLVPTLEAPEVAALSSLVRRSAGGIGTIEQVVMQRTDAAVTRESVLATLAGDLLLARDLVGELTRVAALTPPGERVRYDQLGVQCSGPSGALVRWSSAVDSQAPGLHVVVTGSEGRAELSLPEEGAAQLTTTPRGGAAVILGGSNEALSPPCNLTWQDAIRGLELVEAVERSLKRGKTIDLAVNEANETGAFKALMSAAGCLLLLAAPLILVIGLGLARIRPLQPLVRFVPVALALLLVAFLGLQTLRWALPKEPPRG